jgi:hypothetical protein
MKLPRFQADVRAPVASYTPLSTPQMDPRAGGIAGQAFAQSGEEGIRAAQTIQAVADKAEEARQALEFAKVKTAIADKADAYANDPDTSVSPTVFGQKVEKDLTAMAKPMLDGIKDPNVRNVVAAQLTQDIGKYSIHVRGRATERIIEETRSGALQQLNDLNRRGTQEDMDTAVGLIRGLTAGGIFPAETGNALEQRTRKESADNAFSRLLQANPQAALDAVNQRQGIFAELDDTTQARHVGTARTAIEHQESLARARRADQEHAEKKAAEAIKEESELARSQATASALSGAYSIEQLDRDQRAYRWSAEHYQHLRELITNPRGRPSDADTLQTAMLRARSVSIAPADRDWLARQFQAGRLSAEDYAKADNEAQANLRSARDEAKTNLGQKHAQAEQELRASLGITGLLETLTQDQKKAYASALEELTDRSAYLRGQEDPLSVVREIAPRYQAVIADDATLTIEQKTKLLRYKTPQELEAAYQAGQISDASYRIERQRFIEVGAYVPSFLRMNAPAETTSKSKGKPELRREKK